MAYPAPSFFCVLISLSFVVSALRCNFPFDYSDIVSGHLILNICLRHLFWSVSSFFLSLFYFGTCLASFYLCSILKRV